MLALIDCIAFSGLTPEQVDALAHHHHIPAIVAAEWAETVMETRQGVEQVEDALAAEAMVATQNHLSCEADFTLALAQFRTTHPEGTA